MKSLLIAIAAAAAFGIWANATKAQPLAQPELTRVGIAQASL